MSWSEIGEQAAAAASGRQAGAAPPVPQLGPAAELPETVVVGYRELMSGPAADRTPQLQFQRRRGIEIAHADAERLGLATGERIEVTVDGRTHTGPGARAAQRCAPASCGWPPASRTSARAACAAAPAEAADA